MRDDKLYLCSGLIRVSTSDTVEIANLEQINPNGCAITLQKALPIGTRVRMRCLECPDGKKVCKVCRFSGRVRSHEFDPLIGTSTEIDFEGRIWSPETWHPRHMLGIPPAPAE